MAADRLRTRGSVRTAVVWRSVRSLLVDLIEATGRDQLDVLDAGGGTGGFAVPLAELGHRVTVVDASPDSLAALVRRAADAGVTDRIRSVQGDAASLLDVVAPASFDLVVLHSVLEIVESQSSTTRSSIPQVAAAHAQALRNPSPGLTQDREPAARQAPNRFDR